MQTNSLTSLAMIGREDSVNWGTTGTTGGYTCGSCGYWVGGGVHHYCPNNPGHYTYPPVQYVYVPTDNSALILSMQNLLTELINEVKELRKEVAKRK